MGTTQKRGRRVALAMALFFGLFALAPAFASAGGLTTTRVRLNRLATATDTTFRVVFTTSASPGTVNTLKVDLGAAWGSATGTVSTTQATSVATCPSETGATAIPGTLSATGTTGATNTVTVSGITGLTASTSYCVDFTTANSLHTPTVGSYYATVTTQNGATVNDTAKVNIPIISNDSITVTATVPPSFTFALDANTTAFTGSLAPGTKQVTTPRTVTINTNAKTGWVTWLRNSTTNGLYSPSVNYNIAPTTPGTAVTENSAPSTEQYVWGVTASTQTAGVGATSLVSAYDATGGVNDGSGIDNSYRQVASSNGTSQNAVLTLVAAATVSPITPAASDYSNTIQVIGAGNF